MILKELTFSYFLRFGPVVTFKFPDEFNILITGRWADQKQRSNRVGKSLFIETIKFLLYGETRVKYNREIPNDNFDFPAEVSGIVEADSKELEISRVVDKNNSSLEVKGWGSIDKKILQTRLNNKFGYLLEDFVRTSYFSQGEIHQFMDSKSAQKLSLLEHWCEILDWSSYESKAKIRKAEVKTTLDLLAENIGQKEQALLEMTEVKKLIEKLNNEIESVKEERQKLKQKIEELEKSLKLKDKAEDLEIEKREIENRLFQFGDMKVVERILKELRGERKKYKNEIEKLEKETQDFAELNSRNFELGDELEKLNLEIGEFVIEFEKTKEKAKGIGKGERCPIDKKKCVRVDAITKFQKEKIKELKKLEIRNKKYEKQKAELTNRYNNIGAKLALLTESKNRINKLVTERELLLEKIKRTKDKLELIESLVEKEKRIKSQLTKIKTSKFATVKASIEEHKQDLEGLDDELAQLNESLGKKKYELKTHKETLEDAKKGEKEIKDLKKEMEVLNFMSRMFGRNGIRASQLKSRIEDIESETNNILDELDSKLQIRIATERELGSWEPDCVFCGWEFPKGFKGRSCKECENERQKKTKEEFDIRVVADGKVRSFDSESGGAKVLISLAIRLSIIRLRKLITGKDVQILFLDEIFGMLDVVNREHVYRLLLNYAREKLGFKQIFQISHISDGFIGDERIEVVRKRKYSEARWL